MTNLLAYAYDADAGTKGERAREVLGSLDRAVVSTQVLRGLGCGRLVAGGVC